MKFIILWQFHPGKLHEGYSHFCKMTPSKMRKTGAAASSRLAVGMTWHAVAV
jgi:hypothetical protein